MTGQALTDKRQPSTLATGHKLFTPIMSAELANARAALDQASAKGVGRSLKRARLEKV